MKFPKSIKITPMTALAGFAAAGVFAVGVYHYRKSLCQQRLGKACSEGNSIMCRTGRCAPWKTYPTV